MALCWEQLRLELRSAGRVRCEHGWRLAAKWSQRLQDFDLWCVWAGKGNMQTRNGPILLRPGVCLWMRPGSVYEAEQDPNDRLGVTFIHFHLCDYNGRGMYDCPTLPGEVHDLADVNFYESLTRRVVELLSAQPRDPACREHNLATAKSLLLGLLMDLDSGCYQPELRPEGGTRRLHQRVVMQAATVLSEDPANQPVLAELASRAGYSADHFARIFKQILGQSPQDYAVQARINRARQLLVESSLSVGQVADALGYQDIYFFSRQFRQKTGLTPTNYRRGEQTRMGGSGPGKPA